MKTLDLSNVVVLIDGIKNNQECEITTVMNRRVYQVLKDDRRYVFFLRKSNYLMNGKYLHEAGDPGQLMVVIAGYGHCTERISNEDIDTIKVSTLKIRDRSLTDGQVMLLLEIFFSRFDGDRDCFILATFNQAKLESLARSHKESSEWEKLCYRIHRVKLNLPRYKNLSFDFMRRMGRYLFGKLPGKSSSPTRP